MNDFLVQLGFLALTHPCILKEVVDRRTLGH